MSFTFDVRGQEGQMPAVGLGTAAMRGEKCVAAVRVAIQMGYRSFDTALLYSNQEAVGEAIRQAIEAGEVTRSELWITSKVGFYPATVDGPNSCWTPDPESFHKYNKKGLEDTACAIDLCLMQLKLDYVDLMLIHNPCTDINEYQACVCPLNFELLNSGLSASERRMVLQSRLAAVQYGQREEDRAETWRALEAAQQLGKCRFIGVSNYPWQLIQAMESYATVMPAVNQLEMHPWFSSPALRAFARSRGMLLSAYGTGNCVTIAQRTGKDEVLQRVAANRGLSPLAVVMHWTLQHGITVLPRSGNPDHMAENLRVAESPSLLTEAEMVEIDALNEAHPYYLWPVPLLAPGTAPDI